eukprot:20632-Heterococcus_DN1.PRE.4
MDALKTDKNETTNISDQKMGQSSITWPDDVHALWLKRCKFSAMRVTNSIVLRVMRFYHAFGMERSERSQHGVLVLHVLLEHFAAATVSV